MEIFFIGILVILGVIAIYYLRNIVNSRKGLKAYLYIKPEDLNTLKHFRSVTEAWLFSQPDLIQVEIDLEIYFLRKDRRSNGTNKLYIWRKSDSWMYADANAWDATSHIFPEQYLTN